MRRRTSFGSRQVFPLRSRSVGPSPFLRLTLASVHPILTVRRYATTQPDLKCPSSARQQDTLLGLNGFPRSLTWPISASAAEMARRLSFPPLGFLRGSAFARLTTSTTPFSLAQTAAAGLFFESARQAQRPAARLGRRLAPRACVLCEFRPPRARVVVVANV
jgi:hypothetical protein